MGGWGPAAFENDEALDWFGRLQDICTSQSDALQRQIDACLMSCSSDTYIDLEHCNQAIAAIEILASMRGHPDEYIPDAVVDLVTSHRFVPPLEMIDKADQLIVQITKNSELQELWLEEDDIDEWLCMKSLRKRLKKRPKSNTHKKANNSVNFLDNIDSSLPKPEIAKLLLRKWTLTPKKSLPALLDLVLDYNPEQVAAYILRAGIRQDLKDMDGAMSDFTEAIKRYPLSFFYFETTSLFNDGKYEVLLRYLDFFFNHALVLGPGYELWVHYRRAAIFNNMGESEKVLDCCRLGLEAYNKFCIECGGEEGVINKQRDLAINGPPAEIAEFLTGGYVAHKHWAGFLQIMQSRYAKS